MCSSDLALEDVLTGAGQMEQHTGDAREMAGMRASIAGIRHGLAGFRHVGPSFQVMATLAQIETAHIGSAGVDLGHLAEEFRSAGESIRSRVEQVLEPANAIEARIEAALRDAEQFDRGSLQALPPLITAAKSGLGQFRARQERSRSAAAQLTGQSAQVGESIADIVASIQFHDITRQRVEHVIEALQQLLAESQTGRSRRLPAAAAGVIDLQLAQLSHAESAFRDAIRQMDGRLEEIAAQVAVMASETSELLGPAEGAEASFYTQMEECFRAIGEAATGCDVLERGTQAVVADLAGTLKALRASVSEIHAVEWRLRRLAINAAITGAHIGSAAEPLQAVAAAMNRLLDECESSSAEADSAVEAIAENLRSVTRKAGSEGMWTGAMKPGLLRTETRDLHLLSQETARRAGGIASAAARLSADIQSLRQGISAEQIFAGASARCRVVLSELKKLAGPQSAQQPPLDLGAADRRYTMHAERAVHASVMNPGQPPTAVFEPVSQTSVSTPAPSEFGENVELF